MSQGRDFYIRATGESDVYIYVPLTFQTIGEQALWSHFKQE